MQGWMRYHFFESKSNDIQNCDFSTYNCACSFHGNLIFGDDSGYLTYINNPTSDLNPIQFFDLPIKKLLTPTEISAILILAKNSTNSAILLANPELNETYSIIEFKDEEYIEPSFLTILDDASFLAFTHDYHKISIYKIPSIDSKNSSMNLFKQLEISQKITNLHFSKDNFGTITLYYTTESSIGCYKLQRNTFSHVQFEEFGVSTELSCVVSNGRLAICTDTKISFYTPNGIDLKFPSIELDSSPYKITWYREYLIGYFNSRSDSLRIYQLDTHCVFGTSKFGKESQFTLFEWGSVILVRIPGKLTILTEFSIEKKVNVLCTQSKQFEVALKLSKMHRMSEETVAEIHRQLGDSRLQKRDYDGAISEYIEAIGFLAPSYVITLFLEPQHAEYLIRYLEALHDRKLEDSRHTTLRFNCYTKLKRTDSINKIVEQCISEAKEGKDPNFDVDSAVDVLKQGGYIEQATKIALAYEKHITYCSIMDGISDYNAIYRQMKVMPPKILNYIIMNYGMKILHNFGDEQKKEFTEYIGDSCCQTFRVNEKEFILLADQIHIIFCDLPFYELMFIRIISEKNPRRLSENLWNRLIILTLNNDLSSIYDTIIKANYRYSDENILFALKLKLNEIRKEIKSDSGEVKSDNREVDEENLIKSIIIIFEHQKCYREVLFLSKPKNYIDICKKYEREDPYIWNEALQKATESNDKDSCRNVIRYVMEQNKVRLNEILQIIKGLKSCCTLDMFIDLTIDNFQKLQDEIDEKTVKLEKISEDVQNSYTKSVKINTELTLYRKGLHCSFCKEKITYPAKFFKCGHVFHIHCLGDETEFCMKCREENEMMAARKIDELKEREQQTVLLPLMRNSEDGISILESVLRTGIMTNEPSMEEEKEIHDFFQSFSNIEED